MTGKDKDLKPKNTGDKKSKIEKSESNPCCCYMVDPCGCYVDPCGCYVDPCCC